MDIEVALYKRALDTWGPELQLAVIEEECSELYREAARFFRNRGVLDYNAMADEVADFYVCIGQLKLVLGCDAALKNAERVIRKPDEDISQIPDRRLMANVKWAVSDLMHELSVFFMFEDLQAYRDLEAPALAFQIAYAEACVEHMVKRFEPFGLRDLVAARKAYKLTRLEMRLDEEDERRGT